MPYELTLAPDLDRGGHRYRAALTGAVEAEALRRLSDWLADAKLNPDATFVIDLSSTTAASRAARRELRALVRRHSELRAERRLEVLAPRASRRRRLAASATGALPLAEALAAGSVPIPL